MPWECWFVLLVVLGILVTLARNWVPADVLMTAAVTLIVAVGEFAGSDRLPDISGAVAGMGNTGLITVGVLFVVVAGLVQTGAVERIAWPLLGRPRSIRVAQARMMAPVVGLSAFLNNTPVVAMFMPVVVDLCKRTQLRPSKLYLPLAYAATFGGVCTLVGTSIREGQFRTTYNAAVVAVARGSQRVAGKIGDIVLRAGDTLLLETHEDFIQRQRNSSHFYLVSGVENSQPVRHDRWWVALTILVAMVAVATLGWLNLLTAALLAAGLMVATQCCSLSQARQSVDWSLLIVIAASLGIGQAIESSGLAKLTAEQIIDAAGGHPWLALAAVYFVTMIFTELVTNNAAAVLVFPIAVQTSSSLGVNPMPFVIAIAVGASAGFATPFGYQTNLMVYGPGGYRFSDYLRVGIPLDLAYMIITVTLAPLVWPFR